MDDIELEMKDVPEPEPVTAQQIPTIDKLGRDLMDLARRDGPGRVVGRDREMADLARCLIKREKNNPLLLGDPRRGQNRHCRGTGRPDRLR